MTRYTFHIYDMKDGDFGKIVSRHFSYKEALEKLKQLEKEDIHNSHDYVIL